MILTLWTFVTVSVPVWLTREWWRVILLALAVGALLYVAARTIG